MSSFEKVSLLIGHETIDSQNARLFDLIEEMRAARNNTDPLVEYRMSCRALAELIDYTRAHFSEEERLLQETRYPDYEAHKAAHDNFALLVRDVEVDMHLGNGVLTLDFFCDLLEKWLKEHILDMDRLAAPYLVPAANAA